MSIHTQESVSGFVATDPKLTTSANGNQRLYFRFGQEHFRREEDGSFTQLETSFHHLVMAHSRRRTLSVGVEQFNIPIVGNGLETHIGHADLFALVDVWRAFEKMQGGCQQLSGFHAVAARVTKLGDRTRQIVIVPK